MEQGKYTQGVCEDGAAILENGQPITIEEILERLRSLDELSTTMGTLTTLLTGVANAVKGEPPELTQHSWHDLPQICRDMVKPVFVSRPNKEGFVSVPTERNATEKAVLIGEHKLVVEMYDPEEEDHYLQEYTVPWTLQKDIIRDFIAIYNEGEK
jgi:hypothetical protein